MRRTLAAAAIAFGLALAGPAHADPPRDSLVEPIEVPRHPKLSKRVIENLTVLSEEVSVHLKRMSLDAIDMHVDLAQRMARLNLAVGDRSWLSVRVDSDVEFRKGHARVKARVDLGLAGQSFSVELPEFDVVPDSVAGQRGVVVRVPVFEGRF
jgi:hypothetical protein